MSDKKRHLTQIRPRSGDGPPYSPQRDLAWIYAPAMKEALVALDQANWTDEMEAIIGELGVSEDDISEAVGKLIEAHRYIVNTPDVDKPVDALNKAGWYDAHPGARYLIYGRLGEVMFGGFFMALRDTSEYASESSQAREIAEFIAAGKMVMEKGSGAALFVAIPDSAVAREHLSMCQQALNVAKEQIQSNERLHSEDLVKMANTGTNMAHRIERRDKRLRGAENMGFWRSLWFMFQKPHVRQSWLKETFVLEEK